jgi:hypothetical protein
MAQTAVSKVLLKVLWNSEQVIFMHFQKKGDTVQKYQVSWYIPWQTDCRISYKIQKQTTWKCYFIPCNTHLHTPIISTKTFQKMKCEAMSHPPCSLALDDQTELSQLNRHHSCFISGRYHIQTSTWRPAASAQILHVKHLTSGQYHLLPDGF